MRRRDVLGGTLAAGGVALLPGCAANTAARPSALWSPRQPIVPMRVSVDRIVDVKCCIRPFRGAGPRLDAEQIGDALVVHNYGHGGSGWSLSWGSAEIAVGKALTVLPKEVAVVGCGIIGLTSALVAQRAGLQVTIYARELLPRTRSVRANGAWTPDSRISLTTPAGPAFGALWEQMARASWKTYRSYLGLPGRPVDFCDSYRLSDTPFRSGPEERDASVNGDFATDGLPHQNAEFGKYASRIRDINPPTETLEAADNPFPTRYARRSAEMFFNFGSFGHLLLQEFFAGGGRFVMRDFHEAAELGRLPQKVVINCPGYAARDLMKDRTMIPVRGQTGWLVPDNEAQYGVYYANTSILSKSDGVMVQSFVSGLGEMQGINDSAEVADRTETEEAVKIGQDLFRRMAAGTRA